MPSTGRFAPSPERYGGGVPTLQTILAAFNAARGDAIDTSEDGIVYAENEAIARMILIAWEQNQRFANQFDPKRMTDFLPRWERIFFVTPLPEATETERRLVIAERFLRFGLIPDRQTLTDRATAAIPDFFVSYETIAIADARQWTLPGWPAGPPPAMRLFHTVDSDPSWYSTTAHVLFQLSSPTTATQGVFREEVGELHITLDAFLPAWVTWDWFTTDPSAPGVHGFYFHDTAVDFHNLDYEVFD